MPTLNSHALIILNVRSGERVSLWFPERLTSSDSINFESLDVAGGAKPAFYANREAQEIELENLTIDGTGTNKSIEPLIEQILNWRETDSRFGSPPPLQILTADSALKVVLTSASIEREFYSPEGVCLRARVSLTFTELREVRRRLSNPVAVNPATAPKSTPRRRNPAKRTSIRRRK